MKFNLTNTRVFLRPGVTDLRISTDELLSLIKNIMKQDPLSGAVFLFCNKRKNILRASWWDKTGFWTAHKKLEKHKWPWPEIKEAVNEINSRQKAMILPELILQKCMKHFIMRSLHDITKYKQKRNDLIMRENVIEAAKPEDYKDIFDLFLEIHDTLVECKSGSKFTSFY